MVGYFMFNRRIRKVALCTVLLMSIPTIAFAATPAPTAKPKPKVSAPTKAQIAAAQASENAKAAAAAAATSKLNSAQNLLQQLTAVTAHKQALLLSAQGALAVATKQSNLATAHAALTQVAVAEANRTIGRMAANAYIMGGGFTTLNTVLESNGPQDLVDRLSLLDQVGATDSVALDRYKSALVIAKAAQAAATAAKVAQASATAKVAAAKAAAVAAQSAQTAEVAKLRAIQGKLMIELATARNFRITLQQQLALSQLEQSSANTAAQTRAKRRSGQIVDLKVAQQYAALMQCAPKQLLMLGHKYWHVNHMCGGRKALEVLTVPDWSTRLITQLDLGIQIGRDSMPPSTSSIPSE